MFPKLIKALWFGTVLNQCKNIENSEICKNKHKKERLEKPRKKKLLLLIPENIGDRVSSVSEYREEGVSRIRYFKSIDCFNWLSILHIPYNNNIII